MKPIIRKRKSVIKMMFFVLTILLPIICIGQNNREIKNFNQSFTFNNTYNIHLETNTNSDIISDFSSTAEFNINDNGEGTINFKTFKTTSVRVDYSQIKTTNSITYWNFGCINEEKNEKIQMTVEINPETNTVQSFIVYNEGKEKAYVFF